MIKLKANKTLTIGLREQIINQKNKNQIRKKIWQVIIKKTKLKTNKIFIKKKKKIKKQKNKDQN